ncbi:SH3 domain-containing protein [Neorhizobium sp. JUb45]|nr:SH3 domain-containing protein [Neorhizobium sp. JUb45]
MIATALERNMARRTWVGWAVAGVMFLGWLGTNDKDNASTSAPKPAVTPTLRQMSPKPQMQPPTALDIPASQQPPPSVTAPHAPALERLYTTANVRVRSRPSVSGSIIATVPSGSGVEASTAQGEWRRVKFRTYEGWVSGEFLSSTPPIARESRPGPATPIAPLVRQSTPSRSGEAMRDPYVGTCDCPYDMMSNGRRCGNRSAYSKPGGRSPQCYF